MKGSRRTYSVAMTKWNDRSELESGRETVTEGDDSVETDFVQVRRLELSSLMKAHTP